jgi:hypothetical protein
MLHKNKIKEAFLIFFPETIMLLIKIMLFNLNQNVVSDV